ncbi:recombinase family protein [uncultured Selenomonas sp.]|uniref:recombinase family protein n=1 Tax=uncultured Selenomonas sp. TaxID=159275 RepID=UPI0028DBB044|nr:recombinase family protein [uncultured Selenomonas sp.]
MECSDVEIRRRKRASYFNIVRLIFRFFLDGMTACRIAKELTAQHILMVTGKAKWSAKTIRESLIIIF